MKGLNNRPATMEPALSQAQRVLSFAANFYHELLTGNVKRFKEIYECAEKGKIIRGDIKNFKIGFCPSLEDTDYQGRALVKHHCEGFLTYPTFLSKIVQMGLIKEDVIKTGKDICDRLFDTFAGCITFPVYDAEGKIQGIVGRNILESTWMSVGIESRRWLYGIHKVRYDIQDRRTVILVETISDFFLFYDVISRAGMSLVVATIRPEVTPEAIDILSSLAVKDFFIAIDLDELHRQKLQETIREKRGQAYYISDSKEGDNSVRKIKEISNLAFNPALKRLLREAAEVAERMG